jgi:hypothetical protein
LVSQEVRRNDHCYWTIRKNFWMKKIRKIIIFVVFNTKFI